MGKERVTRSRMRSFLPVEFSKKSSRQTVTRVATEGGKEGGERVRECKKQKCISVVPAA